MGVLKMDFIEQSEHSDSMSRLLKYIGPNEERCVCLKRNFEFNPKKENDNLWWWCETHNVAGVVYHNGEFRQMKSLNHLTGDYSIDEI